MARLLLFAAAREAAGCRQAVVHGRSVGEALALATERFGSGFRTVLDQCSVFVGDEPVPPKRRWEVPVDDETEVAVLPPVSGGQGHGSPDHHATGVLNTPTESGRVKAAVLTVSDRCARGERVDEGGPLVAQVLVEAGAEVVARALHPDDRPSIEQCLLRWCEDDGIDVVLTTGGTGIGPRDVTPEATSAVLERELPGIPEAMRAAGRTHTPLAALSRQVAGHRGATLIVNLPGSPKGAVECLEVVLGFLLHAVELVRDGRRP